jgi:imidazolonepropionase-like amidohydrolase
MRRAWPLCAMLLAGCSVGTPAQAARTDDILILGNPAGSQTVADEGKGVTRAEYSFNDRGRGDHIIATWTLDARGIPTEYSGGGNDYLKAPVSETFKVAGGKASWHNRYETGTSAAGGFYVPVNAPPEFMGVLARALLKAPQHRLALLPSGEASLEILAAGADTPAGLTQYRISGIDFSPTPLWLDRDGATVAQIAGWFSVLSPAGKPLAERLRAEQAVASEAWSRTLAQSQTHEPKGELVIRNARLFDPRDLTLTPGTSVVVRGAHIVRTGADAEVQASADAEIIDAHGRVLMPGLWDNHQHFADDDGELDLAGGVTSARDMANDTDKFLARVARFDAGSELGPRVWKSGIIDGTGPLAGPTKMRVDDAAGAVADVDWYASHGYGQIKIYSSVPPALVPVIADAAHERGLRVSGHVPAFMSARQFVSAGADEIQHLNFIVLNFLYPQVQETRNMNRFSAVAAHAREFSPDKPQVAEFIAFLREHHTVLDPTMNVFEAMFSGNPAGVTPGLEEIAPRLPPQVQRTLHPEALPVPAGEEDAYRAALPAMLTLLKALYDAGVTIIPGTDSRPCGYLLHHELELYVRAGIPAPEVLRMATLTSARVIGVDAERGVIAPGRLADMILVDGNPLVRIADLHNLALVIKGGRVYDPAHIERALGIAPRKGS